MRERERFCMCGETVHGQLGLGMTVNKILCVRGRNCLCVCMIVSWWSGVLRMTVYVLDFRLIT